MPDAYARESLTVGVAPTGPTAATRDAKSVQAAFGTVEGADVRLSYDGVDPTGTAGHLVLAGGTFTIDGASNVRSLRLIRDAAALSNATVTLTYEGR